MTTTLELVAGLPRRELLETIRFHHRQGELAERALGFYLLDMERRKAFRPGYESASEWARRTLDLTVPISVGHPGFGRLRGLDTALRSLNDTLRCIASLACLVSRPLARPRANGAPTETGTQARRQARPACEAPRGAAPDPEGLRRGRAPLDQGSRDRPHLRRGDRGRVARSRPQGDLPRARAGGRGPVVVKK
jgi:hypothetical protein